MPSYLSPEWVQAFDESLSALDLSDAVAAAGQGSITAADGTFAVAQEVEGGPDGAVRTVLSVADGRAHLELDPQHERRANVTIALSYDDALAMARGRLDPADALATGRIRVRGELAVLVAAQSVLAAAAAQLGTTLDALTDADDAGQTDDANDSGHADG